MKCKKYSKKILNSYIDGLLGKDQTEALTRHLEKCSECGTYVADLKNISRILSSADAGDESVPDRLWIKINRRIDSGKKERFRIFSFKRVWVPLAAAAAIVIVLFAGPGRDVNGFNAPQYVSEQMDYIYGDRPLLSDNFSEVYKEDDLIGMALTGEL